MNDPVAFIMLEAAVSEAPAFLATGSAVVKLVDGCATPSAASHDKPSRLKGAARAHARRANRVRPIVLVRPARDIAGPVAVVTEIPLAAFAE